MRQLSIALTVVLFSLFLFPFNLPFATGVNTKMVLAAVGLALFLGNKSAARKLVISRDFLILSIICILISIWAFLSTTINRTEDYTFARYFVSVWVWLGGAYTIIWILRAIHGEPSVRLIGNYIVAVCVAQCLLAYGMTLSLGLKSFINALLGESDSFMGIAEGRMYGLGAALDPAGLRFSAALVILAYLISKTDFAHNPLTGILYLFSFAIITIIGNMIARTTTVGASLALGYLIILPLLGEKMPKPGAFWSIFTPIFLLFVGVCLWLYHNNMQFRTDIRFGFEGFFSLVEKGRWDVHSNALLKDMIIWPDSLKTWLIGDGYFDSPQDIPDKFGQVYIGFYKKTDIGYLRYIFYFGVIGMAGMLAALIHMTVTCSKSFYQHLWMFIMLLLVTLIGWLKVSSDIIMVFAPFLVLAYLSTGKEPYEKTASN